MAIYADYLDNISPSWLNDVDSKKLKKAFADSGDQIVADALTALNQIRIDTCDDSALELHRRNSNLLKGRNETPGELRAYLKTRWDRWAVSGTRDNIINDLRRNGFVNARVWSWIDLITAGATNAFGGGYRKLTDGSMSPTLNKVVEYMYVEPDLREYNDYYAYSAANDQPSFLFSYNVTIQHVPVAGARLEAQFIPRLDGASGKFIRDVILVTIPADDLLNPIITSKEVADYINKNGVYDTFLSRRFKVLLCNIFSNGIGNVYAGSVRLTMPQTSFFFVDINLPNGFLPEKKWNAVTENNYTVATSAYEFRQDTVIPTGYALSPINYVSTVTNSALAVGNTGRISTRTALFGAWTNEVSGTVVNLRGAAISATNFQNSLVVGDGGTILKRDNLGNWNDYRGGIPATANQLNCVANFGNEYCAGNNGTMMWRTFAGWLLFPLGGTGLTATTDYYGVCNSGPNAYFCGYDTVANEGIIAFYNNMTANLNKETIPATTQAIRGIFVSVDGNVWAVGDNGLVLRKNAGVWSVMPKITTKNLRSVTSKFVSVNGTNYPYVYIVGDDRTILEYSVPTGNRQLISLPGNGTFYSISYNGSSSPGVMYAAGYDTTTNNALLYISTLYSTTMNVSGSTNALSTGALWDDKISHWDIQEPYQGALGDIFNIIRKWKPATSSCRYVSIRMGDKYISIPMHEQWELDAVGDAKFDFYNESFASDPDVEYKKVLNSIYYRGY